MRALFRSEWLDRGVRLSLGTIFIFAAAGKIADPADFARNIANYQLLPAAWINPLALFLPWLELVCGLGLIAGVWTQGCALLVACMLVVFSAALGFSAYRGLDIHCGCFSADEAGPPLVWLDLVRDLVLLSVAVMVLYRTRQSEHALSLDLLKPPGRGERRPHV